MECGNSWKEYGNSRQVTGSLALAPAKTRRPAEIDTRRLMPSIPVSVNFGWSASFVAIASGFALFLGLAAVILNLLVPVNPTTSSHRLQVEGVTFEELVRNSGAKIVRVTGKISNTGPTAQIMPRVSIVLRSTSGAEVARWQYVSQLGLLQPGRSTHFVSVKPVNVPVVTSADAYLEPERHTKLVH